MLHALCKNWWLLLLRGIVAIGFGVLTFAWPGITLLTLVLFYGAFALVDGVLAVAAAVMGGAPAPRLVARHCRTARHRRRHFDLRLAGRHRAHLALVHRRLGNRDRGLQIVCAIALRKEIDNEWLLIASGALSVLFGCAWRPMSRCARSRFPAPSITRLSVGSSHGMLPKSEAGRGVVLLGVKSCAGGRGLR
jgi:hypothetical protein